MEAKAKVKDIAISRERVTLRDVLHEGNFFLPPCSFLPLHCYSLKMTFIFFKWSGSNISTVSHREVEDKFRESDEHFCEEPGAQVESCGVVTIFVH